MRQYAKTLDKITGSVYNVFIRKTLKEVIMEKTKVTWTLGYTLNTGNFQSLRLDASVEDFVRDGETTKDASDRV